MTYSGSGLLLLAVALLLFVVLLAFEANGGRTRAPWLIVAIYYIGGKWLISGIPAAFGAVRLVRGLKGLGQRIDREEADGRCGSCGKPYWHADYRADAKRIGCMFCSASLPWPPAGA
jgi:hypothetical protein